MSLHQLRRSAVSIASTIVEGCVGFVEGSLGQLARRQLFALLREEMIDEVGDRSGARPGLGPVTGK
jgi:hypothetical protein